VIFDEEVAEELDRREAGVIRLGDNKFGAGGKEREVEGVEVFERRGDVKEEVGADEGGVGEGTPMKGSDGSSDSFFDWGVEIGGEDEEEHMVGEEGNDEDIDEEDSFVEGEGADSGAELGEAVEGLSVWGGEDLLEGNAAADGDAEVGRFFSESKFGPGAGENEVFDTVMGGGG
jgi:hypothetical protein